MSYADGISRALNSAFQVERSDLMDNLVAKLDGKTNLLIKLEENSREATKVIAKAHKMDEKLCVDCEPYRTKLRKRAAQLAVARVLEPLSAF